MQGYTRIASQLMDGGWRMEGGSRIHRTSQLMDEGWRMKGGLQDTQNLAVNGWRMKNERRIQDTRG